ncbi:MAG: hypothetical protein RMJ87_13875, partial [Cytophagales bacterium]|nr:hypothetical protein [Cytophagales bacterium]
TAWELNNKGFFIERSEDGIHFHRIGFVQAAGNGNLLTYYQYVDELERIQTYYYRLRQEDYDQSFTYSKVIAIAPSDEITGSVELYQEGAQGSIYLRTHLEQPAALQVELYNVAGAKVGSLIIEVPAGSYVQLLHVPVSAKGLYVAQVLHKKVPVARQKILFVNE